MDDKTIDLNASMTERLRRGESAAIKQVYKLAFPACAHLITNNSGTQEDAKDLFQECLIVLFKNLRKEDFELTCTVKTYLYSVARNLWLKRLNKKGSLQLDLDEPEQEFILIQEDEMEEKREIEQKHQLIANILRDFKDDCKQLLTSFYFKKLSLKEIAEIMGYTYSFARVKKSRCMEALKKAVQEKSNE